MYVSREAQARRLIQSLRPQAVKNGLGPAVVNYHVRQHLPKRLRALPPAQWKSYRYYGQLREEAEYYRPPFIPDLSEFYGDELEIVIYEIEDKLAIPPQKKRDIERWIGYTMDGWEQWHLLVIITNRYGLGWDIMLDTKKDRQDFWLQQLRSNRDQFLRTYPDLTSEEIVRDACQWMNWSWPTLDEFGRARDDQRSLEAVNEA
jgi:hypothetical protein